MPDTVPCELSNAAVREEKAEAFQKLVRTLFERRHHEMMAGDDQQWATVELVQSLRRKSEMYREHLSSKMAGPLPFALGYLRIHDGAVTLTTDEVPAAVEPKKLAVLLSEFLKPGAELRMEWDGEPQRWIVRDVAKIEKAG
jgi:hypothetical protein